MNKCNKCHVDIITDTSICPLCKNRIDKRFPTEDFYPTIEYTYKKHDLVINILKFCSVLAILLSLLINYLISSKISWAYFVVASIITFWITINTALLRRTNFMRLMFAELNLLNIVAIIWDYCTGFHMWSVTYVFPFICTIYIIIMLIMRIFMKVYIKDNIFHIYINCMVGLVPGILIILNIVHVRWPSIISVVTSIIIISFLIVFNRKQLENELTRMFHI
ncbi:MAG: DUF6320 domain-containing protein [Bacilli bacterium]